VSRVGGRAPSRVVAAVERAWDAQRRRDRGRRPLGRVLTAAICVLAGLMVVLSALNARGTDLRPGRNTDLVSLVQAQSRRNAELTRQVTSLRQDVDGLSAAGTGPGDLTPRLATAASAAGLVAVSGPALTVTLDDAPSTVPADGVDPDLLVVHQQDIQAVVNALWSAGAEAMTIQGQRVISTTGVKCVGNTVVLHGIPYAPPYVISAIGDLNRLHAGLTGSTAVQIYQQYVAGYGLVYRERTQQRVTFPAHTGSLDLRWATAYPGPGSPSGEPSPR
jgi:uncharacterized protein YlxW (UPF0749 family)